MLQRISTKQKAKNQEVAKIKAELPKRCAICGQVGNDLAHLLPKSIYPEYYTKRENLVILCRRCHEEYDNNLSFRQQQYHLIEQVKAFDALAANRYFRL